MRAVENLNGSVDHDQRAKMAYTEDWRGLTYEEVDSRLHTLAEIPHDKEFADLSDAIFYGTVPRKNTSKVFDAIEYAHTTHFIPVSRADIEHTYRGFRSTGVGKMHHVGQLFPTGKPIHGRRYENKIIFDVSEYDDHFHLRNVTLLQRIGRIWEETAESVRIYSIRKDTHDMQTRNSRTPFVRDHLAFLVVILR